MYKYEAGYINEWHLSVHEYAQVKRCEWVKLTYNNYDYEGVKVNIGMSKAEPLHE